MLILFLLLFKVIKALGDESCAHHLHIDRGEVYELLNPSFPSKDDLGKNCTWTVFAEQDRRIILVCPFNEGADKRAEKRDHCGAKMKIWFAGQDPAEYCRDQTFATAAQFVTKNNRMFISYNNDFDNPYTMDSGFICYAYAPFRALWDPVDLNQKAVDAELPIGRCNFFLQLEHHDVIRLRTFDYDRETPWWRKCQWTIVSPKRSKVTVTCPYTSRAPDPLLMQMQPCTGEFTIATEKLKKKYHCSAKTFSKTTRGQIVLEYMSFMRQPLEEFECYVHLKSRRQDKDEKLIEPLPYANCDHFIELHENTSITTPNHPENAAPGSACRWTVISRVHTRMALNCDLTHLESNPNDNPEECNGKFSVMSLGKTENHCPVPGSLSILFSRNNEMTVTYNNPSGNSAPAVECVVTLAEDPPLDDCESCYEYKSCDHIIKLNNREIKQLHSPRYPELVAPETKCRWTVVAETDRKIVFVCPFSHSLYPGTPEETPPYNGVFTVTPEGGNVTQHSQNKGFFRIGGSSRMVITYANSDNIVNVDAFTCYLYAELEDRWDQLKKFTEVEEIDFNGFDYNITLGKNSATTLVSPSDVEDQKGWSKSRWNVYAPQGSQITIACHFTDKPPVPLMMQLVPCWGQFTILSEEAVKTFSCADGAFSYSTSRGWAGLSYENPQGRPADNFLCFAYSEDNSTAEEVTEVFGNENCDHAIVLAPDGNIQFESEQYLTKVEEGHISCRWTFIAPPQKRIRLDCPTTNEEAEEELICHGQLTVLIEGKEKTTHCSEKTLTETSVNNRLVMIYENGFGQLVKNFICTVTAEEKETTETETDPPMSADLPYANCDQLHNLNYDEMAVVELPDIDTPGTACRWTIVAPRDTQILFSCPHNFVVYVKDQCNSYFQVSKDRKDETHYCRRDNIEQLTKNYWTIVTYENPSDDTNEGHFECYAYVEKKVAADSCVDCVGHEALDYSRCDIAMELNEVGQTESIKNPSFPQNFEPGMPCRWTINSPELTGLFLECDLDASEDPNFNESVTCRGMISVYTPGPDHPKHHCRHSKFTAGSSVNKLVVTYGNQIGASTHPLKCYVTVEDGTCKHTIKLPHMQYNQYVKISTPFWDSTVPPACIWSVESEIDTNVYVLCSKYSEKRYDTLIVSSSGDEELADGELKSLNESFFSISVANKMTVLYNMTEETKPNTSIGCRFYVDKAPPRPECNCGHKFNKLDRSWIDFDRNKPSRNRRIFSEVETQPDHFPFMGALVGFIGLSLRCAASIVSHSHAISAANCFCGLKLPLLSKKILYLSIDQYDLPDERVTEFLLEAVGWHMEDCEDDKIQLLNVALFEVKPRIYFTNLVGPVCLPFFERTRNMDKEPIIFLGWRRNASYYDRSYPGLNHRELLRPPNLMKIDCFIDDPSNCLEEFSDFQDSHHFCVTFPSMTNDCPGKVAGHIFWKDPATGLFKLVGIEDGRSDCGSPNYRAKVMKITNHLDWIGEKLSDTKLCDSE